MTNEELDAILKMGSDEEAIADLLRQAEEQEGIAADTRGKEYLIGAGRVNVANPWGAVSDMFVRGNAEKKAEKARGDAANARAQMDQTSVKDFFRAANNQGLGGVDLGAPAPITAPKLNVPNAPQVGAPPPAGPVGPPAPAAAPPAPAPAPAPAAAAAAPVPPMPTRPGQDKVPFQHPMAGANAGLMDMLSIILRGNSQGKG